MSEFDYLIFVNDAKKPVAGFAFKDDAVIWVKAKRWSRNWKIEIRKADEMLFIFFANTRGVIVDESGAQEGANTE